MLPTFLVIGAMKAGTTSLHAYLSSHPDVFMSEPKELDFFVEGRNWDRGLGWYEDRFAGAGAAAARGEASTNYTKDPFFGGVPERIHSVIPDVRLVYVVRHPIRRMVSEYWHHVAEYGERRPLGEALRTNPMLFALSDYAAQLDRYTGLFPPEHLLVITSEALYGARAETLRSIFSFLGIDDAWRPPNLDARLHRSEMKAAPTTIGARVPWLRERAASTATPAGLRRVLKKLTERFPSEADSAVPVEVEAELRQRFRVSVERLRAFLPPSFDGWGIG